MEKTTQVIPTKTFTVILYGSDSTTHLRRVITVPAEHLDEHEYPTILNWRGRQYTYRQPMEQGKAHIYYEKVSFTLDDYELTTKDGLLYIDGEALGVHEADLEARRHGFQYAEQLIKSLQQ